jgi:hypothetical protein
LISPELPSGSGIYVINALTNLYWSSDLFDERAHVMMNVWHVVGEECAIWGWALSLWIRMCVWSWFDELGRSHSKRMWVVVAVVFAMIMACAGQTEFSRD